MAETEQQDEVAPAVLAACAVREARKAHRRDGVIHPRARSVIAAAPQTDQEWRRIAAPRRGRIGLMSFLSCR
jgi:hypothetical protein